MKLVLLSLLVLGCVHATPVAEHVALVAAPTKETAEPTKEPAKAVELPNRAAQIVQLASKDAQCSDLRRPGDTADSALCVMPGGAFVWLSVSATALKIEQIADEPKKAEDAKPASSTPAATTKATPPKGAKNP